MLSIVFDPSGQRVATTANDRKAVIWSADGLCRLVELGGEGALPDQPVGHTGTVRVVAWSHDEQRVATGADDNTVRIWDAASGQCLLEIAAQDFAPTSVAFSPDDTLLATTGHDGSANVWRTADGERVLSLAGFDAVVWSCAFSADGSSVTAVAANGRVRTAPTDPLAEAKHRKPTGFTADERQQHELDGAGDWVAATSLVAGIAGRVVTVAEVIRAIEGDPTLTPGVRAAALELASERRDSPQELSRMAWWVMRSAAASPATGSRR